LRARATSAVNQLMTRSKRPSRAACACPLDVLDCDAAVGGVAAGPVQKQRGGVQAGHSAAAGGQPVGDGPVVAGQVQDLHAGLQLQQPPQQLGVGVAALLAQRPSLEVEVVLVEQSLGVEARLVHTVPSSPPGSLR
jgi:hypothetical protein